MASAEGVNDAVNKATPADIVLLAPGAYNERITINKPVTLRVTRRGPAVIGTSVPPTAAPTPSSEENDAALRKVPGVVEGATPRLGFPGEDKKQPK